MSNSTTIKNLEQERAKFAYKYANKVLPELKERFKSHVKSFPMLIKTNGLGAAVAFLFSKKDKENGVYELVGNSIVDWLKEDKKYKDYGIKELSNLESLSKGIVEIDSTSYYRALIIEVLAFFNWLRRFAEGLMEDKQNGS